MENFMWIWHVKAGNKSQTRIQSPQAKGQSNVTHWFSYCHLSTSADHSTNLVNCYLKLYLSLILDVIHPNFPLLDN